MQTADEELMPRRKGRGFVVVVTVFPSTPQSREEENSQRTSPEKDPHRTSPQHVLQVLLPRFCNLSRH